MIAYDALLMKKLNIETAEIGDEVGMLNVETGEYHILNPVGSEVWSLLECEKTVGELIEALLLVYDIDKVTCEKEVVEFLEKMIALGLIKQLEK